MKRNIQKHPKRIGERWTKEEENRLIKQLKRGIDVRIIAANHERTKCAINARIKEIVYKMYVSGKKTEQIQQLLNMDCNLVTNYIQKHNEKINKTIQDNSINIYKHQCQATFESNVMKELGNIKEQISELSKLIHAIYEFEDVDDK